MDHGPLGAHFKPELLRSRFVSSLSINCNEHAFLWNSTWVVGAVTLSLSIE